MATQVQQRRGTTAQHNVFTGANGELTVDTSKDTLVIHDGTTQGGFPLARESDIPTGALASLNSVGASQIDADAVGSSEIAADSVNSEHYVNGSVDDVHISGMAASKLTGALPAIDGGALTGNVGKVLQVVSYVHTAVVSTSSTSYVTMYGATITPKSATSKILVRAVVGGLYMNISGSNQSNWRLARGTVGCTNQATNYHTETARNLTAAGTRAYINMEILDSPATTSATTYNVQAERHTGSGAFHINDTSATSVITLMEIAQ